MIKSLLVSAIATLALPLAAHAQTYTYSAPEPQIPDDRPTETEQLSSGEGLIFYGITDFMYSMSPDGNIFATRTLLAESTQRNGRIGSIVQVDCGRGLFRRVYAPLFFDRDNPNGLSLDMPVMRWLAFDPGHPEGLAMMKTCETAAADAGIDWIWE